MKYNNYHYRRRRSYGQKEELSIAKKLVEQFVTQLIICAIAISLIYGAQVLKIGQVEESMHKVKAVIAYSPSWEEVVENARNVTFMLMNTAPEIDETSYE